MVKLINQKSDFDCVIATLAMFFGKSYENIFDNFFKDYKYDRPVSNIEEEAIFKKMGAKHIELPTWTRPSEGCTAIVAVPSLNLPGKTHAIYFDGNGFLDPQKNRENRKFYDYNSEPDITALVLDLRDKRSIKLVADSLWYISFKLSQALR